MIEKMKFLSITGPKADIDRVVNQYLSKYEIHLENALSELKTVEELRPFMEINPYKELLNKANEFVSQLSQPVSEETGSMDVDTAVKTIQELWICRKLPGETYGTFQKARGTPFLSAVDRAVLEFRLQHP